MVTHYQGPRSRGQVVSSHLCNLWAYIGVHTPSDSYLPAHSAPSQDEGGCGEFPTPHAGWPSCPLPGGRLSLRERGTSSRPSGCLPAHSPGGRAPPLLRWSSWLPVGPGLEEMPCAGAVFPGGRHPLPSTCGQGHQAQRLGLAKAAGWRRGQRWVCSGGAVLWGVHPPRDPRLSPAPLVVGVSHFLMEHHGQVASIPTQPGPRPFPGLPA